MTWTKVVGLYLVGALGSGFALLVVYGGANPSEGWLLLQMAEWPWMQMVLVLTLVVLAAPWPLAATISSRRRFDETVIAAPWLLGPAAFFWSYPGLEELGRWSDPAAMTAVGLVGLLQTYVSVESGRHAWNLVRTPQAATERQGPSDRIGEANPLPFPVRDLNPSDPELDTTEIGWDEGYFPDGRPFLAECWADTGMTAVTFFFSWIGLENASEVDLARLLQESGLVRWTQGEPRVSAKPVIDQAENRLWSVSVVVGLDDETLLEDRLSLKPYPRPARA